MYVVYRMQRTLLCHTVTIFSFRLIYFALVIFPLHAKPEDKGAVTMSKLKSNSSVLTEDEFESRLMKRVKNFTMGADGSHIITTTLVKSTGDNFLLSFLPIALLRTLGQETKLIPQELVIKYFLYTSKTKNKIGQIITYETELSETNWDPEQKVVFIVHGYMQSGEDDSSKKKTSSQLIKAAYMETSRSENIVLVDWHMTSSNLNYFSVIRQSWILGEMVSHMIITLKCRKFLTYDQVKLVGYSLGAHISGVAGFYISKNLDTKIAHITGLDPAGPGFGEKVEEKYRLDKDDAEFVDVIHTNMGNTLLAQYGTTVRGGHVEFLPNGGRRQPGCEMKDLILQSCSHGRAVELYASTVRGSRFKGCTCHNVTMFENDKCKCKGPLMGDLCPTTASGQYFVKALPREEDKYY